MGPIKFAGASGMLWQACEQQLELTGQSWSASRGESLWKEVRTMTTDTIAAPVQTVERGFSSSRSDSLAIEEPLQLCLNGSPLSITMRTPGSDMDLAVGFLFTEGIIDDVRQILSMRTGPAEAENCAERVTVWLQPEVAIDPARIRRNFYTSSSCGVCGKLAIGAIEVHPSRPMRHSGPQFRADLIYRLHDLIR